MKTKHIIMSVIISFAAGLGAAFWLRPSSVEIEKVVEERVVEVVKEVRVRDSERNTRTVVTEKPDGTRVTETVETEKAKESTETNRATDTAKRETYKEERKYAKQDWIVGGGLTFNLDGDRGAFVSVSRRLLLNVYVTGLVAAQQPAFGGGNVTAGLGVSFTF